LAQRMVRLGQHVFRSLAEANYRRFFIGNSASVTGTWMQRIGQDWLVLQLTDSALALGGSMLCQFLPVLIGSVWGGVVVDRLNTRRLLLGTQAAQAVLAAALAVVVLTDTVTLAIVYVLAALLGMVTVVDNPARHSFVVELVDRDDIVNAQALNSLINNMGRLVGPVFAGVLIAISGVGITFVINACSFMAVMMSLLIMDTSALRTVPVSPRAPGQVREGLRYVWVRPELRATLVLAAVVSVFGQNFRVVFPVLASDTYGGGATIYGWLTAALGAGAVIGGLISAAAVRSSAWYLWWSCLAFALTNLVVAATASLTVGIVAIVFLGLSNMLLNTFARATLQLSVVPAMRGRVMAIYVMVFLGGIPIGGPLLGGVLELWGPRVGMAVAGGCTLIGCAAVLVTLRRLSSEAPSDPFGEALGETG
jgi:predicted MFS family arabinose efflux permease